MLLWAVVSVDDKRKHWTLMQLYNGPVGPPGETKVTKVAKPDVCFWKLSVFCGQFKKSKNKTTASHGGDVFQSACFPSAWWTFPLCSHRTEYWILSNNYASKLGRPWSSNALKRINERRRIWPKVGPRYLVMWNSSSSILSHLRKWEITASKDS